jgi:hypothetical protein
MQTKILGSFFAFIFGLMLFSSCAKDTLVPEGNSLNPSQTVSFANDIQPIFTKSCALSSCHNGSKAPDLSAGKAYAELMSGNYVDTLNPKQSVIYTCMAPGGSMANFSTKTESDYVLTWIEQGAKDN